MIETSVDPAAFAVQQREVAANFAKAAREKAEDFDISTAIKAYLDAKARLHVAKTEHPDLAAMIDGVTGNMSSIVDRLFTILNNTKRFKNVQYIAYDETHIMTRNVAIVPTASFPSANVSNTLSFEQMQKIAANI
jgi:hypothetical protein